MTAAVVAVVLAVVAAASGLAHHADTHVPAAAAPAPRAVAPALVPATDGGIDFTTSRGSGRLVVLRHTWSDIDGLGSGRSGLAAVDRSLSVEVEIRCTDGSLDYEPGYFSLFDRRGTLVEAAPDATGPDALGLGTLEAGDRVRGLLRFDLPRTDATLVLSDDFGSVTAVKVPG